MTEEKQVLSIEARLEIMHAQLEALGSLVVEMKARLDLVGGRYRWEEKVSEAGIEIAGGPTTITKFGQVIGVTAVPTPQGMAFVFCLKDEVSGKFALLSPDLFKPA